MSPANSPGSPPSSPALGHAGSPCAATVAPFAGTMLSCHVTGLPRSPHSGHFTTHPTTVPATPCPGTNPHNSGSASSDSPEEFQGINSGQLQHILEVTDKVVIPHGATIIDLGVTLEKLEGKLHPHKLRNIVFIRSSINNDLTVDYHMLKGTRAFAVKTLSICCQQCIHQPTDCQ